MSAKTILPGILLIAAMFFAGAACRGQEVRIVSLRSPEASRVGIGFIENRDIRYSPFSSKNFSDMLGFELMQFGYRLGDVDYSILDEIDSDDSKAAGPKKDALLNQFGPATNETIRTNETNEQNPERESHPVAREEETYADVILPAKSTGTRNVDRAAIDPASIDDGTRDLLPRRLRTIAGELEPHRRRIRPENRRLTGREVARLAQSNGLDYYIQGAIGRTETGLILETEENTLIFLEIFAPSGERVGAINLSVNDETLQRSSFLQEVSAEIIQAFDREIGP